MLMNDPLPTFQVRWTDNEGGTFTSAAYFSHESADERYDELVTDPEMLSVELVEESPAGAETLRLWEVRRRAPLRR
jgi:hypothetical protein